MAHDHEDEHDDMSGRPSGPAPTGTTGSRAWAVRGRLGGWYRRGGAWYTDNAHRVAVGLGLALVVAGVAGFLGVLDAVQEGDDLAAADEPVLQTLAMGRSEVLTLVLVAVSTVTGPVVLPIVVVVASLVWGLLGRAWWQAGLLAGAMVLSTVVSVALKTGVGRQRPPVDLMHVPGYETTYSFPSGHTIGTATFLLVAAYLLWVRRPSVRGLVLGLGAVLAGTLVVAVSRLYLGYHFLTDVVASAALAVAVLGLVVAVDRRRAVHAARRTAQTSGAGAVGRPRQDSNLRPAD